MKVLVVGGGGREHAIVQKLRESREITALYCAPGNGGIARDAVCVPIKATDVEAIADWAAAEKMDYVVVTPDDPLCLGLVDLLAARGIPAFGPDKAAARIEGSKVFAKDLMRRYGIPTARYETFDDAETALSYVRTAPCPVVVKADGLALGKGVLICETNAQAEAAVIEMMKNGKFGASGSRVVVEEFLEGPEVSVLCFTDGTAIRPMASSMDHKRALDGDRGLNTGGMGVIAPNPYYTPEVAARCMEEIFLPTLAAMREEGCPFRGLFVLRTDDYQGRPEGDRIQLPLRRSRDAGGAAAVGERPVCHHAGDHGRHAFAGGRAFPRRRELLCGARQRRLS